MKKLSVSRTLCMRTCLFHPKELATRWSGHTHLVHNDKLILTVGRCKYCPKDDSIETSNWESPCTGCFGSIEGFR